MPFRVLVCDDDQSIRGMVTAILTRSVFEVVPASGGAEAVELLDESFDVIILDLMMPETSGYDVLHHVRGTKPELLSRVIVITAHAAVSKHPLEEPVAAVLLKPFDIAEFMRIVRRIVGIPIEGP